MSRPLFNSRTDELERRFQAERSDLEFLKLLRDELQHRSKPRAVKLLRMVEKALRGDGATSSVLLAVQPTQDSLAEAVPAVESVANAEISPHKHQSRSRGVTRRAARQAAVPDIFCQIRPKGATGCPPAFKPKLGTEVQFSFQAGDSRAKRFIAALTAYIEELQKDHSAQQTIPLENGRQISLDDGFSYEFDFRHDPNLFEGAEVSLVIGRQQAPGRLTSQRDGQLIITVQVDLGEVISRCILKIDNTALLRKLADQLDRVEQGEIEGFEAARATRTISNEAERTSTAEVAEWPWDREPTQNQLQFLAKAIGHDLIWLWGPPGTGKTETLSALVKVLLGTAGGGPPEEGERILICSNTNKAVDQLLFKLCENLQKNDKRLLNEGQIVRLGKPSDVLQVDVGNGDTYESYVRPDLIVARKSVVLAERRVTLVGELEMARSESHSIASKLHLFNRFDACRATLAAAEHAVVAAAGQSTLQDNKWRECQASLGLLATELQAFEGAGSIRRFFMRSEQIIRDEISASSTRLDHLAEARQGAEAECRRCETLLRSAAEQLKDAELDVVGLDRRQLQRRQTELAQLVANKTAALSEVEQQLADIEKAVLRDARVLGATITHSYLHSAKLGIFDTVIVDEASMILLPAIFFAAGMSRKRVVIVGDFKQLPPIVQTKQQAVFDELGRDIFEVAGITDSTIGNSSTSNVVWLDEQFRMDTQICGLVSRNFYRGMLRTHPGREAMTWDLPEPFQSRLIIVDTSSIFPFTTRDRKRSRFNLLHAVVIRNIAMSLKQAGWLVRDEQLGICTPFAAQAALLSKMFKKQDCVRPRVGTVHSFQGDERDVIVFDLVDSIGERYAGIFLQAADIQEQGAKLLNVALSRAKDAVVIIGNLTFLDQVLPSKAILRDVLHSIQETGSVIDAEQILSMYPFAEEVLELSEQAGLDPSILRNGVFHAHDFESVCRADMQRAQRSIVVFSGFITEDRTARLGDLFRERIESGVKVRCVTRPPAQNGSVPLENGLRAIEALKRMGVAVDLRHSAHEKIVVVDERIVWIGSLNPLSHTSRTSEVMFRVDDATLAEHLAGVLAVRPRPQGGSWIEDFICEENPRCERCGGLSVYRFGRFGGYFECLERDGWTQNVVRASRH